MNIKSILSVFSANIYVYWAYVKTFKLFHFIYKCVSILYLNIFANQSSIYKKFDILRSLKLSAEK